VLPPRTQLIGLDRSGDAVVLEFSGELRGVPVNTLPLALGQIVLTVTEQPPIRRVHVRSDGVPISYVDATGRRIDRAMVRGDFAELVVADGSKGTS
jgi:spore germination protein GerM